VLLVKVMSPQYIIALKLSSYKIKVNEEHLAMPMNAITMANQNFCTSLF
jgi:hypothetical protein